MGDGALEDEPPEADAGLGPVGGVARERVGRGEVEDELVLERGEHGDHEPGRAPEGERVRPQPPALQLPRPRPDVRRPRPRWPARAAEEKNRAGRRRKEATGVPPTSPAAAARGIGTGLGVWRKAGRRRREERRREDAMGGGSGRCGKRSGIGERGEARARRAPGLAADRLAAHATAARRSKWGEVKPSKWAGSSGLRRLSGWAQPNKR